MFNPLKRFTSHEPAKTAPATPKRQRDALDSAVGKGWISTPLPPNPIQLTIKDFPLYDGNVGGFIKQKRFGMDAATGRVTIDGSAKTSVMDDAGSGDSGNGAMINKVSPYSTPPALQTWYLSQGFPGYQALGIMAQHWLVDKACSMAGNDAVRNGWTLRDGAGDEIKGATLKILQKMDTEFKVSENLAEMNRFTNIFGIRVAYFVIDYPEMDPDFYEKPFNIDGVPERSYKGISQIDPYWMTPMLTNESTLDPSSQFFYDPEYWVISGRKFHRSHLIISRGPQPSDVLKPTYLFGGISLVQRIYERVYAAERTANEAPLLAMNKRTTAIHVDMEKAVLNEQKFTDKLAFWIRFRDNHAVKVLGQEETMEQFDTSLADFDNVIMSQYQLVAAIAETPATKILGTPPKGFNATGEFESVSYHEKLETVQKNEMSPLLSRHYMLSAKSNNIVDDKGEPIEIHHVWEPVDSVSSEKRAEINKNKADTDEKYVMIGSISPDEVRNKLKNDRTSGYTSITDDTAQQTPGLSPENIAAFAEASAEAVKAGAAAVKSGAQEKGVENGIAGGGASGTNLEGVGKGAPGASPSAEAATEAVREPNDPVTPPGGALNPATAPSPYAPPVSPQLDLKAVSHYLPKLLALLDRLDDENQPEGVSPANHETNRNRTTGPSVSRSTLPSVGGMSDVIGTGEPHKLPKMRMHGLNLAVENPRGSIRRGTRLDGTSWQAQMKHHYGYIKGVMGADGDELDCFIGPNPNSTQVHVINQNLDGAFDEHKVMLGFDSPDAAKEGYISSYDKEWTGFDSMVSMDIGRFKSSLAQKGLWNSKLVQKIK